MYDEDNWIIVKCYWREECSMLWTQIILKAQISFVKIHHWGCTISDLFDYTLNIHILQIYRYYVVFFTNNYSKAIQYHFYFLYTKTCFLANQSKRYKQFHLKHFCPFLGSLSTEWAVILIIKASDNRASLQYMPNKKRLPASTSETDNQSRRYNRGKTVKWSQQ